MLSGCGPVVPPDAGVPDAGQDAGEPEACAVMAPTTCVDNQLRYEDVAPIISARCLSCHDGTQGNWPLTDYGHVADWAPEIRSEMLSCGMPPPDSGLTMPNAERQTVVNWIRCGFPP